MELPPPRIYKRAPPFGFASMIIAEATEDIRLILDRFVYSARRVLPIY